MKRVPSYMVPQQVLQLESLPLGSTGKISRRGLTRSVEVNLRLNELIWSRRNAWSRKSSITHSESVMHNRYCHDATTCSFPMVLTVFSLNPDETRFVHREVFGYRCYLKHGIELHEGDCVFDVGANIGLSALFFHLQCPRVHIFAFEPSPTTFACLKANIELHRVDADLFDCGLAGKSGVAEFSFYPGNTVMSGFYADLDTDRGVSKTYMVNSGLSPQNAERMLGFLFKKVAIPCRLHTIRD